MNILQSFKLAIKSLLVSKVRALLTMLGIIIGVAAVIVIMSLGNGLQNYMNKQFEDMGVNLVQVQVWGGMDGSRSVEPDDLYDLVDKYPKYLAGVTPYVSSQVTVRSGTEDFKRTSIYGVGESFFTERGKTMQGEDLAEGRFVQYVDVVRYQNICVIGDYLAQEAFNGKALGQTLSIGGVPHTVVGVLAQAGDSTEGSGDDIIYIPYTCAQRLNQTSYTNFYLVTSTSKETASIAKGLVEKLLFQVFQSEDYYFVMTSAEMMDTMTSMTNTMMTVLMLIAAISLLVGGIGIMNIMLVSVSERTREIGIRKSLGAKRRDIRSQFIIEAGTTSAVGGTIGIVLGVVMAKILTEIFAMVLATGNDGFVANPTFTAVAVSFGVSVGIGILFGYLPANKAAKLNPIDALRYD